MLIPQPRIPLWNDWIYGPRLGRGCETGGLIERGTLGLSKGTPLDREGEGAIPGRRENKAHRELCFMKGIVLVITEVNKVMICCG
jgi:hypothetical protein